jgi:chemotaxis protein CheD
VTGDLRALRSVGELIERERRGGRALASVRPGQCHVAAVPTNLAATVDASVVVCLWDIGERMGGACHFDAPAGNRAILALVDELEAAGCDRRRLRAKLFGGADARPACDLGARNVAAAEAVLDALDVPLVARDTGGERPRKIAVHTDDFSVWVWRI